MKKLKIIAIVAAILTATQLTSCERCSRAAKTLSSDFSGLERTAVLLDYEGDTLKTWTGRFDIRDRGNDNQIFFDLNGKRVWVQGGIFISEEK